MSTMSAKYSASGFTIVELLVVIVVIGILAAISIVSYNNVQARANYSKAQQDMKSITKALSLYYVDNASYPNTINQAGCTYNWCGWDQVSGDAFITGLSPKYIAQIPQLPTSYASNNSYLYQSNGVDYQLLRYKGDGLPSIEAQSSNPLLATTEGYNGLAWGYKTNVGSPWW